MADDSPPEPHLAMRMADNGLKRQEKYEVRDGDDEIPEDSTDRRRRVPRRVIHCSDGVIEDFSTDDEEVEQDRGDGAGKARRMSVIDPKTLKMMPWILHYTWMFGSTMLRYCDAVGEKLAWAFGITSPKYYYEIEDFKREQRELEERKAKMDIENAGWKRDPNPANQPPIQLDPTKLPGNRDV